MAKHLFLPCLTLTLGYIGEYAIIMRSSLLEVMGEDFVQTARAKGVRDKDVRRRHAVPNALLPTFTLAFYSVGFILGGAVIVEEVFSWPGLGQLTYAAIEANDYPVIQAVFLLSSAAVILFNLLADILYGYLDPRVKDRSSPHVSPPRSPLGRRWPRRLPHGTRRRSDGPDGAERSPDSGGSTARAGWGCSGWCFWGSSDSWH